ncbi:MAG: undecaprenyl-diphosphatase UppP [candidate division NC10 bacterium RIFCSPLOWO2_12_FULL_66_18]|nr:MAG: undecaprenyl-diphosphatase UppP [candidate division NC10 bacterium RIFCSPLOWO2_12_FULL_66_18]
MTVVQAITLGLVQGITEFLPISSIAHLRVVPALLGWSDPGAAFSAVIQLGTLAAVLVYFASDMRIMARAVLRGLADGRPWASQEARLAWFILLGTLPIGVCGLAFKRYIVGELRSLYVIAGSLIVLGILLWVAEKKASFRREVKDIGWMDSQLIGLAQALALIPGSSRSGTTMTAAMFLGLTREAAARFSFLLGIPAIGAAGLFELQDLLKHGLGSAGLTSLMIGILTSALSGYLAIDLLLRYLRTRTTYVFAWYRIGLGLLLLGVLTAGVLQPLG